MTEEQFHDMQERIARTLFNASTRDGADLSAALHWCHMQNCLAATANAYCEGMSVAEWQDAARERMGA
jgi:hypothetical protein